MTVVHSRLGQRVARVARAGLATMLSLLPIVGAQAATATTTTTDERQLRVVTAAIAPFVLPRLNAAGQPEGFSVDLWSELARRMHLDFSWIVTKAQSDLVEAVRRGDADVAIAAIVITQERDRLVDFSLPYFDSGLQIMVVSNPDNSALATLRAVPWAALGELGAAALVIVFILANVIWLVERRANPAFQKPYWRAIGEGL